MLSLLAAVPLLGCVLETELLVHDSVALTEASDITRVGDTYYVVKDEKFSITEVAQDGSLEIVGVTTGVDSDHEAIFRLPGDTNDAEPTLVVCGEDTQECSPYFAGLKQETWRLVDGGDNCHSTIDFTNNKGVEGALGLTNDQGDIFMLALIEGTGKIVTYRLTNKQWVSERCTNVPESMKDYSGMSFALFEDAPARLAVTSQKSRALWVGEISSGVTSDGKYNGNFGLGSGTRYDFGSDFKGVEGVFVETVDVFGSMTGVICSDDQGTGTYADAVHRFWLVCSDPTDMTSEPTPSDWTSAPTTTESTTTTEFFSTTLTVEDEYFTTEADGTCPDEDEFITSKSQCELAAQDLGLADVTATSIESEDRPFGCYVFNNKLYFNRDDENESGEESMEDEGYLNLCVREVTIVVTRSRAPTSAPSTAATSLPPTEEDPLPTTNAPTVADEDDEDHETEYTSSPTSSVDDVVTSSRAPTSAPSTAATLPPTEEPLATTNAPTVADEDPETEYTSSPTSPVFDVTTNAPTVGGDEDDSATEYTSSPTSSVTTSPTTSTPIDPVDPIEDGSSSFTHAIFLAALITMLTM